MSRKEKYAEEICAELEQWRGAGWVDDIDTSTMERVITVCQNVVKSWAFDPKKKMSENLREAKVKADTIDEYTEWLRKTHANFDEEYAEDIKGAYLEWLEEQG